MKHKNQYGYFSDDNREYIITDPRTPRPWFNYMWNERYRALISHTGGGFSFIDSPRDNRLTRMRYNSQPWDRPGRYVMVKDRETGEYWSLSWAPTIGRAYDLYECRHGQGYTSIRTSCSGIDGTITYFVPLDVMGEIWRVKLVNSAGRKRKLDIFSFVELLMGNALNDIINQPNDKHFTEIKFNKERSALEATRRYWVLNKKVSVAQPNLAWEYTLHFTQTLPIVGFDGSLDAFTGKWRSEANPIAVESGKMGNTEITAGDPIAALKSEIELSPGESIDFAVILAASSKTDSNPYISLDWDNLTSVDRLDEKFSSLRKKWDSYLSHFTVRTPDEAVNTMLNVWNQYQAAVTFDMARNAGYYHGGLLFGTGIRDQFQDILGVVIAEPGRVRKRLLNALRFQFEDGSTLHNFFVLTDTGEKTNHSDTPLWIPFGIVEYLNETGDLSILDEEVPFHQSSRSASVYRHMIAAIDYALSQLTHRGLPRIWNGDWNDTLDKIGPEGKGETVWGAFFLAAMMRKTFELLELRGDAATLARYRLAYENIAKSVDTYCWDGEWYIRAFRDNGNPVGVSTAAQGKVFINAQTWSVISGIAPREKATAALEAVRKHLLRPKGVQICWPPYISVEEDIGLISRCVPGKKENGAIFNHASSWAILAFLLNDDAGTATDIYRRMLPPNSARDIDRYEVEPYVFAEYVTSPDHPTEGQASHSWLTGSAVWMLRIGIDYLMGFRTSLKGVTISPAIPADWKECSAERMFRGKKLQLRILNPEGVTHGIKRLMVNGMKTESALIEPERYPDAVIQIGVELGK